VILGVLFLIALVMFIGSIGSLIDAAARGGSFDYDLDLSFPAVLIYFAYDWATHALWKGQTIGKRVMRIRVISLETRQPPEPATLGLRSAILVLPLAVGQVPFLWFLGFFGFAFFLVNVLWQLWDEPFKQCLHDKPAQTIVDRVP
jgi:uncharacterized RDD family membrane protein YckC